MASAQLKYSLRITVIVKSQLLFNESVLVPTLVEEDFIYDVREQIVLIGKVLLKIGLC